MSATLIPNADDQRIAEQLALAKSLREQGMSGTGGSGMAGQVYMVGNQYGNLAKMLGGAAADYMGGQNRDQLQATRDQQKQEWLGQMPSATETQRYDPVSNPGTGPLVDGMEVPKDPRVLQQAMYKWGIKAPEGMEAVRNHVLTKAMDAPEREAEILQKAKDRMDEIQLRLQEGRITKQEADARHADLMLQMKQMGIDASKSNLYLAASLRPAPTPHTSIAYSPDGKGYLVDMRTGAQTPLESIGKVPGAGGAGAKLPIQAQKLQSSLQNLESGLNAYEQLLKQYNPQSGDALTPEKRAALSSAFGDLRMQLKGAYELGAITGPDMQVLEGVLTDPTGPLGMAKGAIRGNKTFDAQITQTRAALERQKRNFEQQYKVELPAPAGTATAPMPGAAASGFKVLGVRDK
jgi:hypothetical protein